jgi:hypothetical protein
MSSDEEYDYPSSDEIEMSSEDEYEYVSIKPSDIVKENNAKSQEQKDEETQQRIALEHRIQRLIDYDRKNKNENIFNMEKNMDDETKNVCIEDMNSVQLKEDNVDCKDIHDVLQQIFNKQINELYKTLANKDKWDDNIREFINYHENMNLDVDTSWLSTPELDEIQEQGFQLFTGDKCANVDEDEFDGPNDLSIEEWETVDEIILYYYSSGDIFV